jgi:hypothetical protein
MNEEYKRIEDLISRFAGGLTTAGEESELYSFFKSDAIPPHLKAYQAVFRYFESGLPNEYRQSEAVTPQIRRVKKTFQRKWITAGLAAAVTGFVVLISIPGTPDDPAYNPYEGSYMVRNGVRIDDHEIIKAEWEKIEQEIAQREMEIGRVYRTINKEFEKYAYMEDL